MHKGKSAARNDNWDMNSCSYICMLLASTSQAESAFTIDGQVHIWEYTYTSHLLFQTIAPVESWFFFPPPSRMDPGLWYRGLFPDCLSLYGSAIQPFNTRTLVGISFLLRDGFLIGTVDGQNRAPL